MNKKSNPIEATYILLACINSMIKIINSTYLERLIGIPLTTLNPIITYLSWVFLILIFFLQKKINKKRLLSYIIISLIIIIVSIFIVDKTVLTVFLFIICYPQKLELNRLGKKIFKSNLFIIIIILILSYLGITINYTLYQHGVIRKSLGFVSPNACANTIAINYMLWSVTSKNRCSMYKNIIWLIIDLIIYKYTNSRMALLICIFNFIINILDKRISKKENLKTCIYFICKNIIAVLFALCISSTIYFSNNTNSKLYNSIDQMTTGRLHWIQKYYNDYGINIFGQEIKTVSLKQKFKTNEKWTNIDNSYIAFSIKYGLVFIVCFTFLYIKVADYIKKEKNYRIALFIIIIAIMGLTENILLAIGYNFSLFVIAKALTETNVKQHIEVIK